MATWRSAASIDGHTITGTHDGAVMSFTCSCGTFAGTESTVGDPTRAILALADAVAAHVAPPPPVTLANIAGWVPPGDAS